MQLTDFEEKELHRIRTDIYNRKWSNEALVELIKLGGETLNIMRVPQYCKIHKMTYPGAIKSVKNKERELVVIFDTRYIIDNK